MQIMPGAEALSLEAGDDSCLLLHGLTGSPSEMCFLAQKFHEAHYSVRVPLLPGHGTNIKDLNGCTWHDWFGAVVEELFFLKNKYRNVYVAGLSMGGLLTLTLLALFSEKIHAAAVLSTPMKFKGLKPRLVLPIVARSFLGKLIGDVPKSIPDVRRVDTKRHVCYDRDSLPATYSTLELMRIVRKPDFLARVDKPALIIQARQDPVIHPKSAGYIHKWINSVDKEIVMLEESYHTVTVDVERELLALTIIDFFQKHP